MYTDPFVLPFTTGLIVMLAILSSKYIKWWYTLGQENRRLVQKNLFTLKTLWAIIEVFKEALLHLNIFKKNRLLGYMHMSLAFGWFLLIIVGHLEATAYMHKPMVAPYIPIFLRYFQMDATHISSQAGYWFVMDTLLLFILSGVALAWHKSRKAKRFGLNHIIQHTIADRIARTVLWFIFPLRLIAESISSGLNGGGSYLTLSLGSLMGHSLVNSTTFYTSWWLYSIVLGVFFITLPYSRYMHIPTEVFLIFLRNYGVKSEKNKIDGMACTELHACSSCGLCLDTCQLFHTGKRGNQSPYLFKAFRNNRLTNSQLMDCLQCGRCSTECVVGIPTNSIRQALRVKASNFKSDFSYLASLPTPNIKADVLYFAGCMTHLTPGIKRSMNTIFKQAGVKSVSLDQNESICCGRPLLLAGQIEKSFQLIEKNKSIIEGSSAKTLVTSCPICYKFFNEEYNLKIEVLHHTQYIHRLITTGKIQLEPTNETVFYHDPCELGRGSGIYEEPREILKSAATLCEPGQSRSKALCCGGSLANTILTSDERQIIAREALKDIIPVASGQLITACPLCKKTFAQAATELVRVRDISEWVSERLLVDKEEIYSKTKIHSDVLYEIAH